jgi:hypothetical protein
MGLENLVLLAIRVFWLVFSASLAHLQNGLAYPVLILAGLIGWRGWRPWWLAPLILAEAIYAADLFSHASGRGKLPGAMSNVYFQFGVFALLALVGFVIGWAVRRRA